MVAGHQIALNVVSLLFMLPLSIGMALTLRVRWLGGAESEVELSELGRWITLSAPEGESK